MRRVTRWLWKFRRSPIADLAFGTIFLMVALAFDSPKTWADADLFVGLLGSVMLGWWAYRRIAVRLESGRAVRPIKQADAPPPGAIL